MKRFRTKTNHVLVVVSCQNLESPGRWGAGSAVRLTDVGGVMLGVGGATSWTNEADSSICHSDF